MQWIARTRGPVFGLVLIVAVAGVAYWAGLQVAEVPAAVAGASTPPITVVQRGSIERVLDLAVSGEWPLLPVVRSGRDGVVTSTESEGQMVDTGDVLLSINLEPVVVASGTVPMFRDLVLGAEGEDVRQIQTFLQASGFGPLKEDGVYSAQVVESVKAWQGQLRVAASGVVSQGAVVFMDTLPARVRLLVVVGDRVSSGSDLAQQFGPRPLFAATASGSQRAELLTGMSITIRSPLGGVWSGALGTFTPSGEGVFTASIDGVDCSADCTSIPLDGTSALSGTVVTVPAAEGIVVPLSAITELATGSLVVQLEDGALVDVRILAESDGLAVVDGLTSGSRVRLPALSAN